MATNKFGQQPPVMRPGGQALTLPPKRNLAFDFDIPVQQLNDGFGYELHDSRTIRVNWLDGNTIQVVKHVEGSPDQAFISALLPANIRPPYPMPLLNENGDALLPYCYLQDQTFEHHLESAGDATERCSTKVTSTFVNRPAPSKWEEESETVIVMRDEWYTPELAEGVPTGNYIPISELGGSVTIPFIQQLVRRTFPRVAWNNENGRLLAVFANAVGKVNNARFLGDDAQVWLLENARYKLLWGDPDKTAEYWIELRWRSDPIRRHWVWQRANKVETASAFPKGVPIAQTLAYYQKQIFPEYKGINDSQKDFDLLCELFASQWKDVPIAP